MIDQEWNLYHDMQTRDYNDICEIAKLKKELLDLKFEVMRDLIKMKNLNVNYWMECQITPLKCKNVTSMINGGEFDKVYKFFKWGF